MSLVIKVSYIFKKWPKTTPNRYLNIQFQVCISTLTLRGINYKKGNNASKEKKHSYQDKCY